MDNSNNPFANAYEPQHHPGASASTIKPFKALDLAPPAAPGVSPFLDNFQSVPAPGPSDFVPAPAQPAQHGPTAAASTILPRLAEPPRAEAPAAPRASQVIAADFPPPGSASTFKPRFFLSSTASVDGFTVETYLGFVSAEIVVPKDLLFRNPAPYGELHRLRSAEDQLQKIKEKALEELTERARHMQADAVVGVRVDISSLDTVACLCSASGTAIRIAG